MSASKILWKEYKAISHPKTGLKQVHVEVSEENIYLWTVYLIVVDPDSLYNGAYLKGQLKFPTNYPYSPPSFKFTPAIYHPNVYMDGRLCISILHTADNEGSDEPSSITWSPAQNVESVLLSILSLLEDPNIGSPANVEASITYKKKKDAYIEKVKADVQRSKDRMPEGVVLPTFEELTTKKIEVEDNDDGWWEENYYDDDEDDEEEEDGDLYEEDNDQDLYEDKSCDETDL
ncbi:hypothetical protein CANINC_004664 [Pichia inconspicua]|uniref:UBC core domain-containing protein n=1 Tax=Pichia inconspicua TaxID=52247 RepID=A0A4T0WVX0_9ASCO|nr:hypothetical protein CANINC_004664 [[Candida] inconspicua]